MSNLDASVTGAIVEISYWVYDLETYPNTFTAAIERYDTGEQWVFEISFRRDDSQQLWAFLQALANIPGAYMVGFNNIGFDYPVLHEFIKSQGTCGYAVLYQKAQAIIDSFDQFAHTVWESDWFIPQLDLYKINHFDNKARRTSLKQVEFNMRVPDLMDLPFPPGTYLTSPQVDTLIDYNLNGDVVNTREFLTECLPAIEFRHELSDKYGRNFRNDNDTKVGKQFFIKSLEESGVACYTKQPGQGRQPIQTQRPTIALSDAVFPYIQFQQPAFNHVLQWFIQQSITTTKRVFEGIKVPSEMVQFMNPSLIRVYGSGLQKAKLTDEIYNRPDFNHLSFISGWKDQSGLNCIVNDFEFVFGTGGIHGSVESQSLYSDDEWIIEDWDVASYYPNLAIANRSHPAHLGEQFCDMGLHIFEQRSQYEKGTMQNKLFKLALNGGLFGDSNNQFSPFYDPLYTMTITVNGQLLLCLLSEWLMDNVPNLSMIQANTDGLTVRYPRHFYEQVHSICNQWEHFTKLTLESVEYQRMHIRDVNNYVAVSVDGKVKRKGAYEYKREHHQNHSAMVVPIVAEQALLHGVNIEDAVYNHPDIFDFCLRMRVKASEQLVLDGVEQQRMCRYYVSDTGGSLVAVRPPPAGKVTGDYKKALGVTDAQYNEANVTGQHNPAIHTKNKSVYGESRTEVEKGYKVTICNNMMDCSAPINYQYYIDRVKKLVEPLR